MNHLKVSSYIGDYFYSKIDNIDELIDYINKKLSPSLGFVDSSVIDSFPILSNININNLINIDVTDSTKSISNLIPLLKIFSDNKLLKNSSVLVIGGATLQDIVATACCLYHRGIDWIFVPTTALAQGDSCIGSKTSVNGLLAKNQYGVFYPPRYILSCPDFLHSLPIEEIYSGLGDILHYLLPYKLVDKPLKNMLMYTNDRKLLIRLCWELSEYAMRIKSEMVQIDEFDKGPRLIFNYGHTFGHALEKSTDNYLPHGVAVIMGMFVSIQLAISNGYKTKILIAQANQISTFLEKIQCLTEFKPFSFSLSKLNSVLLSDKKNIKAGYIRAIIPVPVDKTIWQSSTNSAHYGLGTLNFKIDNCLEILSSINSLKGYKIIN